MTIGGPNARLPEESSKMIGRMGEVERVSAVSVQDTSVRRTDLIDENQTGGISVLAADTNLLQTLKGRMRQGMFLNAANFRLPVVVLGATAAERLGIDLICGPVNVWIENRWATVIGIVDPLELAPEIDRSALIGHPAAKSLFGSDGSPSTIYVRTSQERVRQVRGLLGSTANPENPEEVRVSRPSDALEARAAASNAFTSLFLGLGAVALVVGGVGVANVMVISVLERRSEIGLRRALGATRGNIRTQFLAESLMLSALGGLAGVALGAIITTVYAYNRGWSAVVPSIAIGGGVLAAVAIGAVAGLYPAIRAARQSPTQALRGFE